MGGHGQHHGQPHEFHMTQLKVIKDNLDNYFLEANERGIPNFPHEPKGQSKIFGLTEKGKEAIELNPGVKPDPGMIYVSNLLSLGLCLPRDAVTSIIDANGIA